MMRTMMLCGAALLLGLGLAACGDDDSKPPDGGNVDLAVVDAGVDTGGTTPDTGGTTPDTGGTTPDTGGVTPDTGGTTPDSGGGQTCSNCHGFPPTTGEHTKHKALGCATCHGDIVDAQNKILDATKHTDGNGDIKGAFTWDGSAKTCAGASCHGTKTW